MTDLFKYADKIILMGGCGSGKSALDIASMVKHTDAIIIVPNPPTGIGKTQFIDSWMFKERQHNLMLIKNPRLPRKLKKAIKKLPPKDI